MAYAQTKSYNTFDNNIKGKWTSDTMLLQSFSIPDSIDEYFRKSEKVSVLNKRQFYSLADNGPHLFLYFNMGYHYYKSRKTAIVACTLDDTTVWCAVYTQRADRWVQNGAECRMHIEAFHPAYFEANMDDYNFDGYKDVFFNFYQSMGQVYGYGYLLTYKAMTGALKLHPESIKIADLAVHKPDKTIRSVRYSNRNDGAGNYKEIYTYKWINDSLRMSGKRRVNLK